MQEEWQAWLKWGAIKPLTRKESLKILSDPKLRRRIFKCRRCFRDKNAGRGVSEVLAKCRMVVLGFNDPDLAFLDSDSPTAQRTMVMILLQIAASLW